MKNENENERITPKLEAQLARIKERRERRLVRECEAEQRADVDNAYWVQRLWDVRGHKPTPDEAFALVGRMGGGIVEEKGFAFPEVTQTQKAEIVAAEKKSEAQREKDWQEYEYDLRRREAGRWLDTKEKRYEAEAGN